MSPLNKALEAVEANPLPMTENDARRHPMASFTNVETFEQLWRGATALASSQLIPKQFQGKAEDCFIALHMASRLGCDPIMLMQSMFVVHGQPGWSAKFMIAQANRSKVFRGGINWRQIDDGWQAYATRSDTGDEVTAECTMAMATAEKWTSNAKYKTMPDLMLKYRAATFLVRLHCPEVMLGLPTADELEDVGPLETVEIHEVKRGTGGLAQALEQRREVTNKETGEIIGQSLLLDNQAK